MDISACPHAETKERVSVRGLTETSNSDKRLPVGDYLGTGMHGGVIFIRGDVDKKLCGAEVGITDLSEEDTKLLKEYLEDYCKDFGLNLGEIMKGSFKKLVPASLRPYGNLYAY